MGSDKAGSGCGTGVRGRNRDPAGWAERVADRIIRRYTAERPGWNEQCESMQHLKLVVLAELLREENSEQKAAKDTKGYGPVMR